MHMFDKERNLFGGHGIVGGQIGLGAGIAFADKYRKKTSSRCFRCEDGKARCTKPSTWPATWKFVIFIIENNQYAMALRWNALNVTDPKPQARATRCLQPPSTA